ncbi:MAG TPA: cation:proton antiporter [Gaiellaceae bacterium]|nr:cation:proton antiporter [Gaiellaceae bacterium]
MTDFEGLAIVAAVAFCVPLLLGFFPGLRLPGVVLELVAGIVIGPSVLGWVEVDDAIALFALVGLAFLLLVAGLEIDFGQLRGRMAGVAGTGFLITLVLALGAGVALDLGGLVRSPLLVAIMLSATSLGIVITILKDAGEAETRFGQTVIGSCSLAEVLPIVLLSLFFSMESSSGTGTRVVLLGAFLALAVLVGIAILGAERWRGLSMTFLSLQDTTAQIRVRGTFLLLAVFVVLAGQFGLEAILGAFLAGALIKLVDTDGAMTHPRYREKVEAAGYGVFIPFFFVTSGIRFDLDALFGSASALAQVPVFLAALLLVRGVPALLYRLDGRRTASAALLQATSLSFIVVAADLGRELGVLSAETAAAVVAAGLVSVVLFPLVALTLLRGAGEEARATPALATRGS